MPKKFSSIAQKNLMALTGLFLCAFLVIHLAGNLVLFQSEEHAELKFNEYANFIGGVKVIKVAAYLTYFCILSHATLSIILTIKNRKSAGQRYIYDDPKVLSPWYTRWMGVLGSLLFVFIVVHMLDFWYPYKFSDTIGLDENGKKDLYSLVSFAFRRWWCVLFYVVSMVALAFHLYQGLYNGCRSLGFHHPKYSTRLKLFSKIFAIAISLAFAAMPVFIFIRQHCSK